jgi:hypothetical protein
MKMVTYPTYGNPKQSPEDSLCKRHNTSDGYIDANGVWKCWYCYREDQYLNPQGKLVIQKKENNHHMRMFVVAAHEIYIDSWKIDEDAHTIELNQRFNYMNQASRAWKKMVEQFEETGIVRIQQ